MHAYAYAAIILLDDVDTIFWDCNELGGRRGSCSTTYTPHLDVHNAQHVHGDISRLSKSQYQWSQIWSVFSPTQSLKMATADSRRANSIASPLSSVYSCGSECLWLIVQHRGFEFCIGGTDRSETVNLTHWVTVLLTPVSCASLSDWTLRTIPPPSLVAIITWRVRCLCLENLMHGRCIHGSCSVVMSSLRDASVTNSHPLCWSGGYCAHRLVIRWPRYFIGPRYSRVSGSNWNQQTYNFSIVRRWTTI